MEEASGLMNLAFPAVVSNTILRRLVGDWSRQRSHNPQTRQRIRNSLGKAQVGGRFAASSLSRTGAGDRRAGGGFCFALPSDILQPRGISRGRRAPFLPPLRYGAGEHRGAHLTVPLH